MPVKRGADAPVGQRASGDACLRLDAYAPPGFTAALPAGLEVAVYPGTPGARHGCGGAVVFLAAVAIGRPGAVWLVPVASAVPLAGLIWHADAMEVDRHALPVAVELRCGLLLLFWLGPGSPFSGRGRARRPPDPPPLAGGSATTARSMPRVPPRGPGTGGDRAGRRSASGSRGARRGSSGLAPCGVVSRYAGRRARANRRGSREEGRR